MPINDIGSNVNRNMNQKEIEILILVLRHHEAPRARFSLSCSEHRPGLAPSIITGGTPWSAYDVLIE